jgi:Fe-S cluster assembly protein SufD
MVLKKGRMSMLETISEPVTRAANPYTGEFERWESEWPEAQPSWLQSMRQAGLSRFLELGFPTLADEDWRYTNVAPTTQLPFKPLLKPLARAVDATALRKFPFMGLPARRLVFVDGHFAGHLSELGAPAKGVTIESMSAAWFKGDERLQQHLGRYVRGDENGFSALNAAFFTGGAFIHLGPNVALKEPVHLVYLSTAAERGETTHTRNLVIAGKGSKLTVIESYYKLADAAYLTNAATELVAGENSFIEHCKYQDESAEAFHVSNFHARLARGANVFAHSFVKGGRLARNNIHTTLAGEGVECILNGLYVTRDEQLADHHMVVEHAAPHGNSHEYFNGILEGSSRGVFHGRILVRPGAQKTDAKQTNKNLLVSDDATADSKPQLEIYADDVRCTHGATIGQLDEEAIFYLRARGIGHERARRMLIHAFAGEIIERVQFEPLRDEIDRLVWERLDENPVIAEDGLA